MGYTLRSLRVSVTPYLEVGVSMSDDTLSGIAPSINNLVTLGAKIKSQIRENVAIFVAPTFTHVTAEANYLGYMKSPKIRTGISPGVSHKFSPTIEGELFYQSINKVDANMIALKFNFKF